MAVQNCTVLRDIESSDSIAESTKRLYTFNLKKLMDVTENENLCKIIQNPTKVAAFLDVQDLTISAKKSMVTAVLSALKHTASMNISFGGGKDLISEWKEYLRKIQDKIDQQRMSGKKTDTEVDKWVDWSEVLKKEKKLRKREYASENHLTLAIYTYIEPLRSDFGDVRIFIDETEPYDRNYIFIDTNRPENSFLNLSEYKTSKKYGNKRISLPTQLVQIISSSLQSNPRRYLFEDTTGEPYTKRNSFTQRINRTLNSIFGRRVTVNILRHSRISSIEFDKTTPIQLHNIASGMGHSIGMQQVYRRIELNTQHQPQYQPQSQHQHHRQHQQHQQHHPRIILER